MSMLDVTDLMAPIPSEGRTVDTLRAAEHLLVHVVTDADGPILWLRNEKSPTGVVILPDEIRNLIECLSAAGLLAQAAAAEPGPTPVDYLARAKRDLAALERGEQVDLSAWGVKDLRAG